MTTPNLLDHFAALEDPRQSWKTLYPLDEILLIVLAGVMAGADDFVEISLWGRRKLDWLRRFRPFEHGVPSHDTLNDVMNALPNDLFAECFTNWVVGLREDDADILAIDGKTSRRAHGADGRPLHLVSISSGAAAAGTGAGALRNERERNQRHTPPSGAAGTARRAGDHRR